MLRAEPTPERIRHMGEDFELGDDGRGKVILTVRDAPLERAQARGVIGSEQYNIGTKFRHHWYRAGLSAPPSPADLASKVFGQRADFGLSTWTENQVFHRERYREAIQHLGKVNSWVLEDVVCREMTLENMGYKLGWGSKPQAIAAATERLKEGLDRLLELWG